MNGELNPQEIKSLTAWIRISRENQRHYNEFCEVWLASAASSDKSGYDPVAAYEKFRMQVALEGEASSRRFSMNRLKVFLRYAAIVIISFFVGAFISRSARNIPRLEISELVVPMGSHSQLTLPDGTEVTLNAGSRFRYGNLDGTGERVVSLDGEGYFKVAKNPERPFIVKTEYVNIIATGTEFNVRAYGADSTIEATLISGSVTVENLNESKTGATILEPNQKCTFYKSRVEEKKIPESGNPSGMEPVETKALTIPKLVVKQNVNVAPVISWKNNRWIFEQESLAAIAVELERRYDVEINFGSERLKSFRFTGIIVAEPIEQVLEVMSLTAPISFSLKGRIISLGENRKFDELNRKLYNQ